MSIGARRNGGAVRRDAAAGYEYGEWEQNTILRVSRVPRVGDSVEWEGHRFTVTRASARRAERVEVRKLPANPAA